MLWKILDDRVPASQEDVIAILLDNRSIVDQTEFFAPTHPQSLTFAELAISSAAVESTIAHIKTAVAQKKKILIYGDYDADGICATAVLWKALHALGTNAIPFIPNREKHGYSISSRVIPEIQAIAPDLIITVDNGIVAHTAMNDLKELGYTVIITDHHQPEITTDGDERLPPALAVVHTTKLCGTTVAWIVARELIGKKADELLDLCAIASIADQVQLKDANRSFAYHGLTQLRQSKRVGLKELFHAAGIEQKEITSGVVGYQIAPRINAMGRIAHGMDALRLLCTTNASQAKQLAELLQQTNSNRQELTLDMLEQALLQAEKQKEESILFVYSETYHEGVIGLIAGKLTEKFYKPTIALSINGDVAKASARSVKGVSIIELLRSVRDDLLEVGGHTLAGGFSIKTDKIELVHARLKCLASETIKADLLQPFVEIDCRLPLALISSSLITSLKTFEPCGQGNAHPLFLIEEATVRSVQTIGKQNQHRKLQVSVPGTLTTITALWWNVKPDIVIQADTSVSLVVTLDLNTYKNSSTPQLIIKDVKNN